VRRTELIWEGKYDAGRRVASLRMESPFQTVEMVKESAQDRQSRCRFSNPPSAYLAKEWRNQQQDSVCWYLNIDEIYDSVRNEPRFHALVEKIFHETQ